ncbi:flagellar hook-length control protein FliK [Clostridium puniceum]|uniref:Flagellar hook-length control protein FliK n=1 Tax=Clostridium puniceum TaxID=29367 RepID=A0A1S8TB67_9CLOT|nr:flagellar hook-length control protein FliK [Clostridium puniceum]OOM75027.1 flagellar hook-length control protein FliK [Clostridium puniceum]
MVTATKTTVNSQSSSLDFLSKTSKLNFSDRVGSDVYKTENNKVISKSESSKSEDFKDVLTSKVNYKEDDQQRVSGNNETKDMTKIDEVKEELKELEDDSKAASKDDVDDILNQLLNLLAKLGINGEELKKDGELNAEALKNIIKDINENISSSNSLSATMEKLMELMKNNSVKEALDDNSLKSIQSILSNLSSNITDDTAETKDVKNSIKNLMSEISNIIENKQNTKVLTLEDMLKNYSQDNKEGSFESESNKSDTSETAKNNKEVSKEDKFLNSLLDDKNDNSLNKINLFASRTQVGQNQGVDTVRGLTINKATFANDLIKDVKFMSTNAMKELTVKINPGDLGEITIKLIQEDGVMKANLKANSKEATALLSQNLADIKKQLTEQNIKIADVNIELYQEDTTFFSEQGFGRQLSEEKGKSGNDNSNTIGNVVGIEEELNNNNITSDDNNIEFFA